VHDGVYITGHAPLTDVQRWWAATLTAPATALALEGAAVCWGIRPDWTDQMTVVRRGTCGPQQFGSVRVSYSKTLKGQVTRRHGLLITRPERTILDLWPVLVPKARERMLREAVRTKVTTMPALLTSARDPAGRRGAADLKRVVSRYTGLPLHRCRSDAEVEGLLILSEAGRPVPAVNVRRAGEEADFSWVQRRLIVEIDGGSFHQDPIEDARKTRVWTRAGWEVRRIPSHDVYAGPGPLLAITA
jgi:hypothetical protein